jgi:hypothetical protein
MKFEEALKCMREGKKVKSKIVFHPIFISDYTNGFGETYKAICFNYGDKLCYYNLDHQDILAEDWEVVEDDNK